MFTVCGIDPGNSGALSLLRWVNGVVEVLALIPMPTTTYQVKARGKVQTRTKIDETKVKQTLQEWRQKFGLNLAVIEEQKKRTGRSQGFGSAGTTMEQYGLLRGICVGLGIPYITPDPQKWQKAYPYIEISPEIDKLNLEEPKKRSIALAQSVFPKTSLLKSKRSKKPCDAFSDALLIGNYYYLTDDFKMSALNNIPRAA